ncbi:NAD-dependent epimerase/dehydratase family protein [Atopomonas hussainii]|uniref:NAD-dependent epimerase/dehydratase family protein n=1 Tax=Atopomonas hussainii TaxID=1429083 RepID=UPI0008FFFF45|nr:NAD-dependent epimerase/dehydratase family protein [Atopomonas hussainii]
MDLRGKKVLVIGGAGFIGSHVVDALLMTSVAEVVIYDNFTRGSHENLRSALADKRCRIYSHGGDIRDVDLLDDAMRGVDCVIHLAAMWLLHCLDFPRTAFDVNIGGTFNVLEACVRHKVQRLVYSSSASVYGDAVETPMGESHPLNNRNFYGATKISGEAMCRAFYERYGLSFVGLRYMNVYGPRQDQRGAYTGVISTFLNRISAGEPPVVHGDGAQAYDFIYVKDVARANVLALEASSQDCFYNIGTGVRTSIRELMDVLVELTGSPVVPRFEAYGLGDSRQLVRSRIGSTVAAYNDLGFQYMTSLKDGVRLLVEWFNGEAKN